MADCKCGIPNCPGHRMVDGKALVTRHPLLKDEHENLGEESLREMKSLHIEPTKDNFINFYFGGKPPKEGIVGNMWADIYENMPEELKSQKSKVWPDDPGVSGS
jgi:hypothetical protein